MPDMAALVVRQEQILLQLADLKRQMLLLKENLKGGSSGQKVSVSTFMATRVRLFILLLLLYPNYIPSSLILLI